MLSLDNSLLSSGMSRGSRTSELATTQYGRLNPSRETKFSGTHGGRGILIFPVQLTTSRIGNLTRLIHTLLYVMTIHTYIHTYSMRWSSRMYVLLMIQPECEE